VADAKDLERQRADLKKRAQAVERGEAEQRATDQQLNRKRKEIESIREGLRRLNR